MNSNTVKFYHNTICRVCCKDNICINTHRTDFVGSDNANRFFNIISPKVYFPGNGMFKISDDMVQLRDLVEKLMHKQGNEFFLNEYPEECKHRQFIDLDANIDEDVLTGIIAALQELITNGNVQVLRNNVSGKVHLILDVPAWSIRGTLRKKAQNEW